MAFSNLFARLSAVEEDEKRPRHSDTTHRNKTDICDRGDARKRRTQSEQTGPFQKRQRHQTRTYNATSDDPKATHYLMKNTDGQHASVGFTNKEVGSHGDGADHNYRFHKGQDYKTPNNRHVNKQQMQKNKTKGHKNQRQQSNRGRPAFRGGYHQNYQTRQTLRKGGREKKNTNDKQDFQVKRTPFMSQEFKDQNALVVDGRLLCRHFLWGRCIKEDSCQLEHVEAYNDLIKEVCKFYIQGFCTKGESCPYMHKSFPCKFFHKRAKCFKGADCRFSHEPLNEVTSQLLEEAIKAELANKAEQESSGQPASTDESENVEANKTADIFVQPLRPSFYQSIDTNPEQEALSCQTEEAGQPHSPPSANLSREEPVCYSVEAVLGPQLSKPFISFFTAQRSQESAPLSSPDCTLGSANQSQAPYSVDAVLRSCKSVENSPSVHAAPAPTAQTVSYIPEPPLSPGAQNKGSCSVNTGNEATKSQEKMFKSLISKTCTEDHSKRGGTLFQPTVMKSPANYKSEGVLPLVPTKHKSTFSWLTSQTSTSKHPSLMKPHLPVLTSDSRASFKPFGPPSGLTAFKRGAAVPAEPLVGPVKSRESAKSAGHHFAEEQLAEIHQRSKEKHLKKHGDPPETAAECCSTMAHCGDSADGCKKTPKRPFHSLFASLITETLRPVDGSITNPICPQGSVQSPCPAPQATDGRHDLKTAPEPDKPSARSFLGLFAAPLGAAPQPDNSQASSCSQQSLQSADNSSCSSDSKHKAADLETPLPRRVRTDVKEISQAPSSLDFSRHTNIEKDTEDVNRPAKQPVSPVPCGDGPSASLPDISPHKGATADSVLKTLFLCLNPYEQDGEPQDSTQISVCSESEKKDKNGTGCVSVRQQQKSKEKFESSEKTVAHAREQQPCPQTPQISSEATGGSALGGPGVTEPQPRKSGTHRLPVAPLTQRHSKQRASHPSEGEKCMKGNKTATPLKDLFKSLDTNVLNVGH